MKSPKPNNNPTIFQKRIEKRDLHRKNVQSRFVLLRVFILPTPKYHVGNTLGGLLVGFFHDMAVNVGRG
ncbi:MAG: hypothetical protein QM689_01515 [Oscillospiraceae bacterium]